MTPQSVTYSANGICTTFPFSFPAIEAHDLEVLLNGAVQTSGFTQLGGDGASPGGAICFAVAPLNGTAVTIRRTGRVQVSGSDAPGFLEDKIVAGDQITITKTFDAAGEHLTIAADIDPAQFQPRDPELDWLALHLSDAGKALAGATDAAAQRSALGLAAVASSGSYADLSDKPNLGSVASHAFEEFASAAQGAKADGALQSSSVDIDGTLAANSDLLLPSQKAVKTYVDGKLAAAAVDIAIDERNILRQALSSAVHGGYEAEGLFSGWCDAFNADTIGANSSGQSFDASLKVYAGKATQALSYTGADQSFTVPAGVTSIDVKLWGAGGRGMTSPGGAGGYTSGRLSVTPGETLTFKVGERGHNVDAWVTIGSYTKWGYGGGADTGDSTLSGGGLTGIWRDSTPLAIAGGGGGGCGSDAGIGGVGGGLSGQNGTGTWPGLAGTQTAAGASGGGTPSPAVAGFGYGGGGSGHGASYGGGGGGGYYGGGGGGGSYDGSWHGGGGGGGSGYIGGLTNAATTAGSGVTPPNTSDADYVAGSGIGGAAGQPGGNGLAVISYTSNMTLVSNALSPAPASAPAKVKLLVLWKDVSGSAVLNTDFIAEATRDGLTWSLGTLVDSGLTIAGFKVLWTEVDVSAQPSGTTVKVRLKTLNSKAQQVKGVAYLIK